MLKLASSSHVVMLSRIRDDLQMPAVLRLSPVVPSAGVEEVEEEEDDEMEEEEEDDEMEEVGVTGGGGGGGRGERGTELHSWLGLPRAIAAAG
jgi:hypothetical protein